MFFNVFVHNQTPIFLDDWLNEVGMNRSALSEIIPNTNDLNYQKFYLDSYTFFCHLPVFSKNFFFFSK